MRKIAEDLVYNPEKYTFFPDVRPSLPALCAHDRLGVVSDAWSSLETVFAHAGLRGYFSTFIISSRLGTAKPDRAMYQAAPDALGVRPEESVFVDDSPLNCAGAERVGIRTILLKRNRVEYWAGRLIHRGLVINALAQLLQMLPPVFK